jgi:ribonuclease D
MTNLQERLKKVMIDQNITETEHYKLSTLNRTVIHVPLHVLATVVEKKQAKIDFPIMLTEKLVKELERHGISLSDLEIYQGAVSLTTQVTQRLMTKKKKD